jgi:hypothetical protein
MAYFHPIKNPGKAPKIHEPVPAVTAANCVQLDNSPSSFGGNQSGGMGQDAECNAFERFLARSLDEVSRFNEQLANEQTNKGHEASSR